VTTRGKNNINIWLPVIISILIGQLRNIFKSKWPRSSSVFAFILLSSGFTPSFDNVCPINFSSDLLNSHLFRFNVRFFWRNLLSSACKVLSWSCQDLCDKQMLRCSENSLQVWSDGTIGSNLILKTRIFKWYYLCLQIYIKSYE
jgi:hypothetical protein